MRGTTPDEQLAIDKRFSTVIVIPFDMDKYHRDINEQCKDRLADGESYKMMDSYCVVKDTNILIDKECVGELVKDDEFEVYLYKHTTSPDGNKSFEMCPSLQGKQKLSEMISEYGLPEVSLREFMDNRYCYNSRVYSNMCVILDEIKKQK